MYRKIVGLLLTVAVALAMIIDTYLVFFKKSETAAPAASATKNNTTGDSGTTGNTTATTKTAGLKDGTYTGKSVDTPHGAVQLQIVVKSGQISTVNVLAYPNEERRSEQINAQALPVLKEEALKAQSGAIQQVSGATETSDGFQESLQNAVTLAQEGRTTQ
ncbi:FMN-binding protein [Schleiferilactobacillus shenzhenensis]|nr:FMN-binding protein [Schleiferilactobacillus shenzhenensis]